MKKGGGCDTDDKKRVRYITGVKNYKILNYTINISL
jgi:hypothetical protein